MVGHFAKFVQNFGRPKMLSRKRLVIEIKDENLASPGLEELHNQKFEILWKIQNFVNKIQTGRLDNNAISETVRYIIKSENGFVIL